MLDSGPERGRSPRGRRRGAIRGTGRRAWIASAGATALLSLLAPGLRASSPEVRIVVPFAPGGASDRIARAFAVPLASVMHERVVVENTDEAGAIRAVVEATPDGRTLLLGSTGSMVLLPLVSAAPPLDPRSDLAPVALLGSASQVLTVHPSLPVTRLGALVSWLRARPDTVAMGAPGVGTLPHLTGLLFARRAGVRLRQVFAASSAQVINAHLKGEIPVAFESQVVEHVRQGRLRAIAVMTSGRMHALPDVPTVSEAGMPGIDVRNWLALFTSPATPAAVCSQMALLVQAAATHASLAALERDGFELRPGSPAQLARFVSNEVERWTHYVSELGLAPARPTR